MPVDIAAIKGTTLRRRSEAQLEGQVQVGKIKGVRLEA